MSSPTLQKPYIASSRQIYSWALGGVALNALICIYGQAMNLLTVGLGMDAAIVGLAMMMPRIIDAVADPFMGHISDNTHTRWGRRKPFLILGCILASIFLFLLWWGNKEWSNVTQLIYLTILGTLFYMSWGLYSMAYTALGYELTDDYNERSRIASIGGIITAAVLLLNGGVYWFTLRPLFHTGVVNTVGELFAQGLNWDHMQQVLTASFATIKGQPTDKVNGIRWVTTIVVLISIGVAFITALNCKERFVRVNKRSHTPIGVALKATFKNKPFISLIIYKLCQVFGERVFQGLLFFIAIYYVCMGDENLAGKMTFIGGLCGSLITFLILPFLKTLSMKLGKRAGMIIPSFFGLVLLLCQPFILKQNHPYLLLVPLLVLPILSVISNTITNAIVPDICDLDELEYGERREGLFTSVVAFMGKLEISLSVGIVGLLVKLSGYAKDTTIQTPEVLQKLLWFAIVPGIFFTAGALITSFRFKMDEAMMNEVREKLEARRAAAGDTRALGLDG